jgi:hypothetical protein
MKTFLVKDASLAFDKNSDSIKLHHPAYGFFTIQDVIEKEGRTFVVFKYYSKLTSVPASACTYHTGKTSWQTQTMTQEQLDVCIKVADAIHGLLQAAKQDKDNVELLALWVSDEASHLSEYIRKCLNEREEK